MFPNLKSYPSLHFIPGRSVDVVILKGSVTNEKTGYKIPFADIVCEMFKTFCPVLKGGELFFYYYYILYIVKIEQ